MYGSVDHLRAGNSYYFYLNKRYHSNFDKLAQYSGQRCSILNIAGYVSLSLPVQVRIFNKEGTRFWVEPEELSERKKSTKPNRFSAGITID